MNPKNPKTLTQRISSNFIWSVLSEGIGKGVIFLTTIYLARVLGVESFGLLSLAQVTAFYLWLLADLGVYMYGIREIAKDKNRVTEIINPILTLRVTSSLAVFILYMTALFILDLSGQTRLVFVGCGLYLIAYAFSTDWVIKGLEQFKYLTVGTFTASAIFLGGILYFVRGSEDLVLASFIWPFSYLCGSIALMILLIKKLKVIPHPNFNLGLWISHIRESIFFAISGGVLVLYNFLPMILLGVYFSTYEVGIFAAPFKLVWAIGLAGYLLPAAFYPTLAELFIKDRKSFHRTHRNLQILMLTLGLPMALIVVSFTPEIVSLLWGSAYQESAEVLRIVIWMIPLLYLRYSFGSVILATGFQKQHNLGSFAGLLTVTISGILLIPRYGIVGASISLIVAEVIVLGSMWMISSIVLKRNSGE